MTPEEIRWNNENPDRIKISKAVYLQNRDTNPYGICFWNENTGNCQISLETFLSYNPQKYHIEYWNRNKNNLPAHLDDDCEYKGIVKNGL